MGFFVWVGVYIIFVGILIIYKKIAPQQRVHKRLIKAHVLVLQPQLQRELLEEQEGIITIFMIYLPIKSLMPRKIL